MNSTKLRTVNPSFKFIRLIFSILILISASATAQTIQPVKWSYKAEQTTSGEATLILTATIEKGWHLYSQNIADGGPIKTTFTFSDSADFELVGKVAEGKAIEFFDKNFDMQLAYFSHEAVFKQKIRINNFKTFKKQNYNKLLY